MQRTIELPEEQVTALEQLAARERRSLDQVVQLAVGDYLVRNGKDWSDWNRRFTAFVSDVRSRIPPDVTPEEIEADITAARAEVRAERAARRATGRSRASGH